MIGGLSGDPPLLMLCHVRILDGLHCFLQSDTPATVLLAPRGGVLPQPASGLIPPLAASSLGEAVIDPPKLIQSRISTPFCL